MNNEIIKIAYKELIARVARDGFLDQFLKENDYYALKDKSILLSVLADIKDPSRSFGGKDLSNFLEKYFKYNPELKKDIILGEQLLSYATMYQEVEVIFKNMDEDNFNKKYELMRQVVKKTDGQILSLKVSDKMRSDEKLRDYVIDLDNFSLWWFDLPPPKNKNLILDILSRDHNSFRMLTEEQRGDKANILTAIKRMQELKDKGGKYIDVNEQIYKYINNEMKADKDVAISLSKLGFVGQIPLGYEHAGVMKGVMDSLVIKNENSNRYPYNKKINISKIDEIPQKIFHKLFNIADSIGFLASNHNNLEANHDSYVCFYKLMQKISKENTYIKDRFKKNIDVGGWSMGNIGETKYKTSRDFDKYFKDFLPKINEEISYYISAENLRQELLENKIKVKKVKI